VRTRLGVKWKARRQEREKEEWRRPLTFVQSCVVGRKAEDSQNPGCQPRAMATVGKEKPRTSRARIRVAGLMRQPGWGRVRLAGSQSGGAGRKKKEGGEEDGPADCWRGAACRVMLRSDGSGWSVPEMWGARWVSYRVRPFQNFWVKTHVSPGRQPRAIYESCLAPERCGWLRL